MIQAVMVLKVYSTSWVLKVFSNTEHEIRGILFPAYLFLHNWKLFNQMNAKKCIW